METRANHVIVGLFVLLLGIGVLAFTVWIMALKADRQTDNYLLIFEGGVAGLNTGSSVNYEGVPIGHVISIDLDSADPGRVRVTIEVDSETPVRSDTTASLELAGLTGGRYIQLSGGTAAAPPPQMGPDGSMPIITTRPSPIEQVLSGVPDVVATLNELLNRAGEMLSEQNKERFDLVLQDAAVTMANLGDATATVADLARDLRTESAVLLPELERTIEAAQVIASNLAVASENAEPTAREIREAAASMNALAGDLRVVVAENRRPLSDFTNSGLTELSSLLSELRLVASNLNQITRAVQQDPAGFLLGVSPEGYRPSEDR
ncbi:MAG TPA: MlaD family protein [Kiloniellales bacterium]|nr:MlaD family protein [Kiloniellales bacterium]